MKFQIFYIEVQVNSIGCYDSINNRPSWASVPSFLFLRWVFEWRHDHPLNSIKAGLMYASHILASMSLQLYLLDEDSRYGLRTQWWTDQIHHRGTPGSMQNLLNLAFYLSKRNSTRRPCLKQNAKFMGCNKAPFILYETKGMCMDTTYMKRETNTNLQGNKSIPNLHAAQG